MLINPRAAIPITRGPLVDVAVSFLSHEVQ